LEKGDKAALEAGNLAFIMAREIQERAGSEVRVLNSVKLPFIWDAPTKTDKEDAMKLAHLVEERRDEKLPVVPPPSEKENHGCFPLFLYRLPLGNGHPHRRKPIKPSDFPFKRKTAGPIAQRPVDHICQGCRPERNLRRRGKGPFAVHSGLSQAGAD
jgi:hypothetical protein